MPNTDLHSILLSYSEWLDGEGLVTSDRDGDPRPHDELVSAFLASHPQPIASFPWDSLYAERDALGADVTAMEEHIHHLRYTADQAEPRLAVMRLRLNRLHDVTEYYENPDGPVSEVP